MNRVNVGGDYLSYLDEGSGEVILFIHGTPTCSYEYEHVISFLKTKFRCIVIDHLGFGNSDKPQQGDYSLGAHIHRLEIVLKHLEIQKFHLVLHDFGAVIGLNAVLGRWSDVQSLVILNSWAWPFYETEPKIIKTKWLMKSWMMKYLYLRFNFSAKFMLKIAWGTYQPLTKEKHLKYQSYFRTPSDRYGTLGFINSLFDFKNDAWNVTKKLNNTQKKKVQIIWGESDKLVSILNIERWKQVFPKAEVVLLPHVGHFVADEGAELVCPILFKFFQIQRR